MKTDYAKRQTQYDIDLHLPGRYFSLGIERARTIAIELLAAIKEKTQDSIEQMPIDELLSDYVACDMEIVSIQKLKIKEIFGLPVEKVIETDKKIMEKISAELARRDWTGGIVKNET